MMKKLYYSLLVVMSCGMIASCQKEEINFDNVQVNSDIVLTATLENEPATRTQLSPMDKGYKMLWSEGDAVSVFNSNETHAKFVLSSGAGKENAAFNMTEGSLSFGTEDSSNSFGVVGVYPYSVNTTVSKENAAYKIYTEIPAKQEYAENSFGTNASPMVGVHPMSYNLSFKNVGTVLVMPLKGEATIKSATLESKSHKIAGATVVTVDSDGENIPVAEVTENGVSRVELSCGKGVQLSATEATKFFFVLAPGAYEANDLVVTFYDAFGNYFATEIPADVTFARSKTNTFKAREFEIQGTKEMDLYIRAEASAYMQADRIIPSLDNVDIEAWVRNLKDKDNTKAIIEEVITYISLKNYKAAFDALDGVPGFVKETKMFEANGSYTQKVDYTGASYLVSMIEQIEEIHDVESLLAYMTEFEKIYEGSGAKNKLDEQLGVFGDNIDTLIDEYVNSLVEQPEVNDSTAFETYKTTIKENLDKTIDDARNSISFLNLLSDYSDNLKAKLGVDLNAIISDLNKYIDDANKLSEDLNTIETIEEIQNRVEELSPVQVIIDLSKWKPSGILENLAYRAIKVILGGDKYHKSINPVETLSGAQDAYDQAIKDLVTENETTINLAKAALKSAIGDLKGKSIVETLEKALETDENGEMTATAKFLTTMFENEMFMNSVKESLRKIVAEIEESSKEDINSGNIDAKMTAVNTAKVNAIIYARVDAIDSINEAFAQTNQNNLINLNNGPWGYFQKVLNWNKCIEAFEKLDMMKVYTALCDLSKVVEDMIAFDKGSIYYNIENIEDYQENVDWWVLETVESL